jgi:HAD domain in Swiss Army Knife RNA repair proteins
MKAIFLDIDVVLNSEETHNPQNFPYFIDGRLLDRFKVLVRITEGNVILSSSWRINHRAARGQVLFPAVRRRLSRHARRPPM